MVLGAGILKPVFRSAAAGFLGWDGREIGGQLRGVEALDLQPEQAVEGATELGLGIAAVDECGGGNRDTAGPADDSYGFRHAAPAGDDILGHQKSLSRGDLETAPEHEGAVFLFGENVAFPQGLGELVPDKKASECGRDDGVKGGGIEALGKCLAESFGFIRVLEEQGALKELTAVATGAEDEVTFQEGTGGAEFGEDCFGFHGILDRILNGGRLGQVGPGAQGRMAAGGSHRFVREGCGVPGPCGCAVPLSRFVRGVGGVHGRR